MTRGAMVRRAFIAMTVLLLLGGGGSALGQGDITATPPEDPQSIFFEALCFAVPGSPLTRLDVFTQVGYEDLSFVKQEERFEASYEITLSVYDSADALVNEKSWTERVHAATFDESVSSTSYSLTQKSFQVHPGKYRVQVQVHDNQSDATTRLTQRVAAADLAGPPLSLSAIMLLNRVSVMNDKRSIAPNVSGNVGNSPDSFYVFLEAYSRLQPGPMRFSASIFDDKEQRVFTTDTVRPIREGTNELFLQIRDPGLTLGEYRLVIGALPREANSAGERNYAATSVRTFANRWRGMPRDLKSLDMAIDQLKYIAKESELLTLREAGSAEVKQQRFLEFWKKRNPNPNSSRNLKMEQYYARVEYANRHFSKFRTGWKTDMGMVYIIFGPPNSVDRHPFESDRKPYEVWSYYNLNYQFLFIDETGFGEYRLDTPIWNYLQRPRE